MTLGDSYTGKSSHNTEDKTGIQEPNIKLDASPMAVCLCVCL